MNLPATLACVSTSLACGLTLGACSNGGEELYFASDHGWALCGDALPVDADGFAPPPDPVMSPDDRRANVAGEIALAFALRCAGSEEQAAVARPYDRVVALNNPGAGVAIEPGPGSALIVRVGAYEDYRSNAFAADMRAAVGCFLAPGAMPPETVCPAR